MVKAFDQVQISGVLHNDLTAGSDSAAGQTGSDAGQTGSAAGQTGSTAGQSGSAAGQSGSAAGRRSRVFAWVRDRCVRPESV